MTTLGVIVANRGFFPGHLCETGRQDVLRTLESQGIKTIVLPLEATKFGAVESLDDARKCAELFKAHANEIDGILVTLPNFGDERATANTIRWSGLKVPVLVHAFNDTATAMTIENRRDSFCGKMSVCNALAQYDIPFSLTQLHTDDPDSETFINDLQWFCQICAIVKAIKCVRFGVIGARPAAFNTVRFSEKILEAEGISIEPIDMFEFMGWVNRLEPTHPSVKAKLDELRAYTNTSTISEEALARMAKFGAMVDTWTTDNNLSATTLQCWTAIEEFYGIVPCSIMSMLSNRLMPSACECDVMGLLGMYILQSASGKPSALLDWNNNYGKDPNKGVLFHCSNLPKDCFCSHKMDYQAIIAGSVGKDNTYGTICGRIASGPFTYCRTSTDDRNGMISVYCGEGRFTDDPLDTFGGYGVFEIPDLQTLLHYICRNGFEHHVAMNLSTSAYAIEEALTTYKGWEIYHHTGE